MSFTLWTQTREFREVDEWLTKQEVNALQDVRRAVASTTSAELGIKMIGKADGVITHIDKFRRMIQRNLNAEKQERQTRAPAND